MPHIESYNQLVAESALRGISTTPRQVCIANHGRSTVSLRATSIDFGYPASTPRECRERQITYSAPIKLSFSYLLDGSEAEVITGAGVIPVMVLSNICTLNGLNVKSLIRSREVPQ